MIAADETFGGTWPFAARFCDAAGFRQHYVDEGEGEAILMLHGEPTWGYLWRNFIAPLALNSRVVVPDHMGFGKSETPQGRAYSLNDHVDNLETLIFDQLALDGITLVLHDWGGPIGYTLASRHPNKIRRIFATNTFLPVGSAAQDEIMRANAHESRWFQWVGKAYQDGSLERHLGDAGNSVIHLMLALQTVGRPAIMTPEWTQAYASAFPTPAESIGALRFPQQLFEPARADAPEPDRAGLKALEEKPAMFVAGMKDSALLPHHTMRAFELAYPGRPIVTLPSAGHFSPEDEPDTLLALLQLFLQTT